MAYDSSTSGSIGTQQKLIVSGDTSKSNPTSDKKYVNVITHPKLCSLPINLLVFLYQE